MEPLGRMLKGVAICATIESLSYAVVDSMTSQGRAEAVDLPAPSLNRKRRTYGMECCTFTTPAEWPWFQLPQHTDNKQHILLRDGLQTASICPFDAESDDD
jgi:hypothetical protein